MRTNAPRPDRKVLSDLRKAIADRIKEIEPHLPFGRAIASDRREAIATIARRNGLKPDDLRAWLKET